MKTLYDILKEYTTMSEPPEYLAVEGNGELLALFGFKEMGGRWVISLEEAKKQVASLTDFAQYEKWADSAMARHLKELMGG